ncbi:MAG: efflux RND transporter permease subunit, partial [Odoribacteraceae bacterium]|nr:efflux RND transporter permease subunit [Odoribacteraceae bacterium]
MNSIIKRKVLISMLFVGLVLMGIFSNQYLPMELYPNAELPELSVGISYKGKELDPTNVESKSAIPV